MSQPARIRQTASQVLGASFRGRPPSIRVAAPETPATSERIGELSLTVQLPPPRLVPPGHESYVSLASVIEDPSQVPVNCEDEYSQERIANLAQDDVTTSDPTETMADLATKDVNLQSFINKCLRLSVKRTKSAIREVRLTGLRSLRDLQEKLPAMASSNVSSEDDENDEDMED